MEMTKTKKKIQYKTTKRAIAKMQVQEQQIVYGLPVSTLLPQTLQKDNSDLLSIKEAAKWLLNISEKM